METLNSNLSHATELIGSQINRTVSQLDNTIYYLSVDTEITDILSRKNNPDIIVQQRNMNAINNSWNILKATYSYPVTLTIYASEENENIRFDKSFTQTTQSIENEKWYKSLMSSNNKTIYHIGGDENSKQLSVISKLYDSPNYKKVVGILRLSVNADTILNMLSASTPMFNVLFSTNDTFLSTYNDFSPTENDIAVITSLKNGDTPKKIQIKGGSYFAASYPIDNRAFFLYTLCPASYIYKTIVFLLLFLIIILVVIFVIAFLNSWRKSLPFIKSFNSLSNAMQKTNLGDFKHIKVPDNIDENISETYNAYNNLMTTITSLIEYNEDNEAQIKKMEFDFLQQEIKPHFLYNTLNTIQALVKESEIKKVLGLINSLSKFYRFSLHNSDSSSTIGTELEHISHYVKIENYKFNNAITLNIDVPDKIKELHVPKLILQPLIENAVHHGIREKINGYGTITINAVQKANDIFIYIIDDGVGIPADKIDTIKYGNSIGYTNTDKRIRLFFGDDCGLDIESIENEYTKIIIKIKGEGLYGKHIDC